MADQPIGELSVQITGDYSKLSDDLAQAQVAAATAGSKVADSFITAAGASNTFDERLQELYSQGHSLASAMAELDRQDQTIAASMAEAARAATQAAQPLMSLNDALAEFAHSAEVKAQADSLNKALEDFANTAGKQTAPAVQQASQATSAWADSLTGLNHSAGSVLTSLLKFAGIQLTIQGIANAAKEALTSFAELQRSTESLTALTGSAQLAEEAIDRLRQLANDEALSFPALLKAEQQMAAFGISTRQAIPLLAAAGDASRATGRDFDSVANSVQRIVESGMAMGRTLVGIGITTADLGSVMGVTADQASKLFKSLDESARVEVITAALGKFKGLATDTANDVSGAWQKLSNTAKEEFQRVGKELADLGVGFSGFAVGAIHALGSVADFFINFVKTTKDKAEDLSNYLKNQAKSWGLDVEDYGKATRDAADSNQKFEQSIGTLIVTARQLFGGFPEYKSQFEQLLQQFQHGEIDGGTFSTRVQVMEGQFRSLHPSVEAAAGATKSYVEQVAALKQQLADGEITHAQYQSRLDQITAAHSQATKATKEHVLSAEDLLKKQTELASELNVAQAAVNKLAEMEAHGKDVTGALTLAKEQLLKIQKELNGTMKEAEDPFTLITKELDQQSHQFDVLRARVVAYKEILATFGSDSEQAVAGLKLINQEQKRLGQATVDAQGALDLFEPQLARTGETAAITATKLHQLPPEIVALADKLGHFPSMEEQIAAGLTVIIPKIYATKDGFWDLASSARDQFGMLKESAEDAGMTIDNAMDTAGQHMLSFAEKIADASQAFKDFATGVGSFSSQLGILDSTQAGSGRRSRGGAGTVNAQGDFNTGFTLPEHTHIDYSLWGISGARVVPDTGWYWDIYGNLVEADWHKQATGQSVTKPGAPAATIQSQSAPNAPAPSGAPVASITTPPEVQALLSMGATIDQLAVGVTMLNDTIGTKLVPSADTLASAFDAAVPTVSQATAQIAKSIEQQSVSFAALSQTLAPITAPAVTPYNPVSVGGPGGPRISSLGQTSTTNNLNINITPAIEDLIQRLMVELQRQGARV